MAERTYTPEQIKVIEHGEGHAVASATAGSGTSSLSVNSTAFIVGAGIQSSSANFR